MYSIRAAAARQGVQKHMHARPVNPERVLHLSNLFQDKMQAHRASFVWEGNQMERSHKVH